MSGELEVEIEVEAPVIEFEGNVEVELGGNVEVEYVAPDIEIEIEAPQVEYEVELQVPDIEIEIEAPQVEFEIEFDSGVQLQQPLVEVEVCGMVTEQHELELDLDVQVTTKSSIGKWSCCFVSYLTIIICPMLVFYQYIFWKTLVVASENNSKFPIWFYVLNTIIPVCFILSIGFAVYYKGFCCG